MICSQVTISHKNLGGITANEVDEMEQYFMKLLERRSYSSSMDAEVPACNNSETCGGTRVEVPEQISAEQRCFRDFMNFSADQRCFRIG